VEDAAVALALVTGAPIDLVERAMLDDNPDMVVILAKIAGFSWSTAQCILLRAANRSLSVQDLDRALSGFSRLKQATARSIIAFYDARRQGTMREAGQLRGPLLLPLIFFGLALFALLRLSG